jgi:hypothetical protein
VAGIAESPGTPGLARRRDEKVPTGRGGTILGNGLERGSLQPIMAPTTGGVESESGVIPSQSFPPVPVPGR